jgi:hypothetical protein
LRPGVEAAAVAEPEQAALVEERERAAFEQRLAERGLAFAPQASTITGHNYSNGDEVRLQAGRVIRRQ